MAQARWLVRIDWNDDGDFSDTGEDVTSDVLGLTLEHFRDLASERVEAARLELELRNDDHRYSPPNGASPLAGNLKPGRRVWVWAAYPYDSFTGSPGTRLASHGPDYDASFAWAEHLGGFAIAASGAGVQTTGAQGGGRCVATLDLGDAHVSFGCDFTRGSDSTDHGGLCFRYADPSNYLYLRVTGAAIEVRKVEAGADSLVASAAFAWSAEQKRAVQVMLHGDSIRVFVDGSEAVDATSAFNSAATRHGLFCDDQADHRWESFGGWVSLFHGAIDAIHPRPRRSGRGQYCYVRALDEMARLTSVTLYTYPTSQLPQTSSEVLGDLLDYAGVDPGRRQMDTGTTLVPDLWSPPSWGVRALDEIYLLQDEEDGFIYIDGHGYWRLEGRSHRASGPHTTSRATIREASGGADPYFSELVWDDGAGYVENMVFMKVRDATNQGLKTAWTLSEKPHFDAGETRDFLAESKAYDALVGMVAPVENTDYEANTSQDGSGADISGELTVTHPDLDRYSGRGTLVRVTFGPTAGYLTLLKLRSVNALTFNDPVLVLAQDAASKSAYGERTKTIDARWTRLVDTALATVQSRLARRKDPRTVLSIVVPNGSRANLMLVLQRGFSDRVTVRYDAMGINQDFYIEGHRITVGEGWTSVVGELLLRGV